MSHNHEENDNQEQRDQEMNTQDNTSGANGVRGEGKETENPESSWRPTEGGWEGTSSAKAAAQSPSQESGVNIQQSETGKTTGDPGRTPGKAEGEEDFQVHGNE